MLRLIPGAVAPATLRRIVVCGERIKARLQSIALEPLQMVSQCALQLLKGGEIEPAMLSFVALAPQKSPFAFFREGSFAVNVLVD